MKSLTRGHLKAGIDSVRGARMRSFWTMLGVVIGVTSVITVVGIGEGIKQQVSGQIHHMGKDLITIRPAQLHTGSNVAADNVSLLSGLNITGSLTPKDADSVAQAPGVAAAAPLAAVAGTPSGDNGKYTDGLVIGTTPALPSLINQSLAYGTFLSDEDTGLNTAVLGARTAQKMFNEDVPLGRGFSFHGQQFIVRGIFNSFDSTPLSQEADFNNAIFIPYDTAETISNGAAPTYEILARASSAQQADKTVAAITHSLNQLHGGQTDFSVLKQNQNLASSNSILELLTRLIAGIAAISLLVGGIGIMNVMLVSVTERMHEIGIRKAIGATNGQILSQFIIESGLLSLTGGVIGIALAFGIDIGLRVFTNIRPAISWQVVLLASGVSLLVGVVFGSVPALKAARKDPIEALRSE